LTADAQYLDATYDEFVYTLPNFGNPPSTSCAFTPAGLVFIVDCSGRTPPQAPEWTLNLGIQQTFPLANGGALVADLHTHYQSKTLTGLEFLAIEQQDAYWMSGFELGYHGRDEKWNLSAYIDNIEDKDVVNATFPHPFAGDLFAAAIRPPRTYGARLRVNF
jgi:iron complex outermembrane receptor protein